LFEAHPDISVNMILTEDTLDLAMREADVAIRFGEPKQSELIRRPMMQVRMRLYASRGYIDEFGAPESEKDLLERRFISFSPTAPQPEASRVWVSSKFSSERSSHLTMNSYFGILNAAISGLGIAALPDYVTRDYPELMNVMAEDTSPEFTAYFCYPQELRRSQRVQAFRDFLFAQVTQFSQNAGTPKVA
jgi:DNA-binding transcriptional LysR family regulator